MMKSFKIYFFIPVFCFMFFINSDSFASENNTNIGILERVYSVSNDTEVETYKCELKAADGRLRNSAVVSLKRSNREMKVVLKDHTEITGSAVKTINNNDERENFYLENGYDPFHYRLSLSFSLKGEQTSFSLVGGGEKFMCRSQP